MARNEITVRFRGDTKDLERSLDKVGSGTKRFGSDLDTQFDKIGQGSRNAAKTAKGLQGALGGLVATGAGVGEIMRGNVLEGILMLEGGFGKAAIGAAKLATTIAAHIASYIALGAQSLIAGGKMALAWIIGLGPIGLVIAGIAAVIAICVTLGIGFDDIGNAAKRVWGWIKANWPLLLAILTGPIGIAVLTITRHWGTIRSGFSSAMAFVRNLASAAAQWVIDRFNGVVSFFSGLPGRVGSIFGSIGRAMGNALKSAWNSTIGGRGIHIPSVGVGPFRTPGLDLTIPRLHQGGVMPGAPGTEGLALLQAGERVTRAGASGGVSVVIDMRGAVIADGRQFEQMVVRAFRSAAGKGVPITLKGRAL